MEFQPEETVLKIKSGLDVHAWYFSSRKPAKAVIVFFHGNGQNRTSHIVSLYWLIKAGYDLLALDYPGYGDTDGKPTPENTVETGHAALRYVAAKKPKLPIIVYGQSLGGAVALRTVIDMKDEIKPALVVADSTFLSYQKAAQNVLSKSWVTWLLQPLAWVLLSDRYAPKGAVASISPIPLLVIHARDDTVVPFKLGEEVFNKAQEPKEFWPLEKGWHIGTFSTPDGPRIRQKFLEKLKKMGL